MVGPQQNFGARDGSPQQDGADGEATVREHAGDTITQAETGGSKKLTSRLSSA